MIVEAKTKLLQDMAPAGYFLAIRMGFVFPVFEQKTLPEKWVERYRAGGYVLSDPVMHWLYENVGAIRWSAIRNPDPRGVLELAAQHGLTFGVAVCCIDPGEGSQRSFASFTRSDREFTDDEIVTLRDLVEDLHIELVPPTNLTKAELEALGMVKNGLLMKEIASLLGVTEGAVKLRLKNAKLKLGAKTSTHAASLATRFGLI